MTTRHHRYAAMSGRQLFNRDALEAGYFADMGRLRRGEAGGLHPPLPRQDAAMTDGGEPLT